MPAIFGNSWHAAALRSGARVLRAMACAALALVSALPLRAAEVAYVYDGAGRVVGVVAPNGDSQRYTYDPAGNITSIERYAAGVLWVGEFAPRQGAIGTSVVIRGGGFSATPGANTVKFNGVSATVSASGANELTAVVPAAATTGPISVTVGSTTATSALAFTVGASTIAAPSISGFTPGNGVGGAAVTINGARFDPEKANDLVQLNGRTAVITSASATQLQVTLPLTATSGRFSVKTPYGSAVSSGDFYVAPTGIDNASITHRGRIVVDGAPVAIAGLAQNKTAQYVFDATAGQTLGLGFSAITVTPNTGATLTLVIKQPDGSDLIGACSIGGLWSGITSSCNLPALTRSGTHQILVRATSAHSTDITLTLSKDLGGTLIVNAAPLTFNTARPGQNGRYTFAGKVGKGYSIHLSDTTIPDGTGGNRVVVHSPGGVQLGSAYASISGPSSIEMYALAVAGTYTVFLDPALGNVGQVKIALREVATGTLEVNGAATPVTLEVAQNGRYTFNGTIGQRLGLGASSLSLTPAGGSVSFKLMGPTGALLQDCGISPPEGECDFPPLPATGTYTLQIDPVTLSVATMQLHLSSDLTGQLTLNAATPVTFNTVRAGQNGSYSFNATAGKTYSVVASDVTIAGGTSTVTLHNPAGVHIGTINVGAGSLAQTLDFDAATGGTYRVFVDPYLGHLGQVKLGLRSVATGTVAIDGTPTSVSLIDGQNGRYTFAGTAGQRLGLGITSIATVPSGGGVSTKVYSPTGTMLVDCQSLANFGECDIPPLASSGTYTVRVDPPGAHSATLMLTLSTDVTGTLIANAAVPTTFSVQRAGQNGRYTFDAQAGKSYSLSTTDTTIVGAWTTLAIHAPDGTLVGSGYTGATYDTPPADIAPAPYTGTYTVYIDPNLGNTGEVKLTLREAATGTLAIDGPPTAVNLLHPQNGAYTFNGVADQRLGLGITGLASAPAGGSVGIKLVGPTGATMVDCSTYSAASGECDFPALPASGTYTVRVDPGANFGAALTLSLSTDVTGALAVNAATPTTFVHGRAGQNGRYTFNGTANKNYSIEVTEVTIPGNWTNFAIEAPDGAQLATGFATAGVTQPPTAVTNVPANGTYTIAVDPHVGNTGQLKLRVLETGTTDPAPQTPDGNIVVNGAALPINVPANQIALYTFAGTAGQRLGLGVSAFTTAPAGQTVTVWVKRPDNTTALTSCDTTSAAFTCNIAPLPATGTYTIAVRTPAAASAALTLTLSTDIAGSLTLNPPTPTLFESVRAGQSARYSFSGTMGSSYSLVLTDVAVSAVIFVYAPSGKTLLVDSITIGGQTKAIDLPNVIATGTYTVVVAPSGGATGQLKLALRGPVFGSLNVNGSPTAIDLVSGQNGVYTFSGTTGQRLALGVAPVTITPAWGQVTLRLYGPTRIELASCTISTASDCDFPALPSGGSHVVEVDPPGTYSASLTLTLSSDITGTLPINPAAPTLFASSRPGQNGRYTYSGKAGKRYSIAFTESTIPGGATPVSVYAPDGKQQVSGSIPQGPQGRLTLSLPPAPVTGSYSVWFDPAGANIGQLKLALYEADTEVMAIDGPPTVAVLEPGQVGRYTYSGTAGQRLGLGLSAFTTTPAGGNVTIDILLPSGALWAQWYGMNAPTGFNLPVLPVNGTYTVQITPNGAYAATQTLTLSNDITGELTPNSTAATSFDSVRFGQDGRFTFSGKAGQRAAWAWTDATYPGWPNEFRIYKPDGTLLATANFGNFGPAGWADLGVLPATGTYTVHADTMTSGSGQSKLYVSTLLTGSIAIDAAPADISLSTGRVLEYTVAGKAGQSLGAILSDVTTAPKDPAMNPLTLEFRSPDGSVLESCTLGSPANSSCRFPRLLETGNYKLQILPGPNAAGFKLQVRSTL